MASRTGEKDITLWESTLQKNPGSLIFARLADAYRKDGNISRAIELCTNGLKNFPHYTTGRVLLGRCYLEQQKFSEAIAEFTAACLVDRRNQMAIKMLADIFEQQGIHQKAGDLYALLVSMDPDNKPFKQLSSNYGTPQATDIFSILGISTASISTSQQRTIPSDTSSTDDSTSFSSDTSDAGSAPPAFDSALFDGEANEPIQNDASFASGETGSIESVMDHISSEKSPLSNENISGEDISERIDEIFTGIHQPERSAAPETPQQESTREVDSDGENTGIPTDSLESQDFDLSDFSGSAQPPNAETPPEKIPLPQDSIPVNDPLITTTDMEQPDTPISDGTSDPGILPPSVTDATDSNNEVIDDNADDALPIDDPASTTIITTITDKEHSPETEQHSGATIPSDTELKQAFPESAKETDSPILNEDLDIDVSDPLLGRTSAEENGNSELPGFSDIVSGTDITNRIKDMFESESLLEDQPDENDLFSDILEEVESGAAELPKNATEAMQQVPEPLIDLDDNLPLQTTIDDIDTTATTVENSSSPDTTNVLAENAREETGIVKEESESGKDDFVPLEFEETLQFDEALFEKMLNHERDTAEDSDDSEIVDAITSSVDTLSMSDIMAEFDNENKDDFDSITLSDSSNEVVAEDDAVTPPNQLVETVSHKNEDLLDDLVSEPDGEKRNDQQFDDLSSATVTFNENDQIPDLILDSTTEFEIDKSSTTETFGMNTMFDLDSLIGNEELSDLFPEESKSFENDGTFSSDNTEIVDIPPDGDDIAGKLDMMFSDSNKDPSPANTILPAAASGYNPEPLLPGNSDDTPAAIDSISTDLLSAALQAEESIGSISPQQLSNDDNSLGTGSSSIHNNNDDLVMDPVLPEKTGLVEDSSIVSGSDVVERIASFFPSENLMTASSENETPLEQEPELEEVPSDFYTITGDYADEKNDAIPVETLDIVEVSDNLLFSDSSPSDTATPGDRIDPPANTEEHNPADGSKNYPMDEVFTPEETLDSTDAVTDGNSTSMDASPDFPSPQCNEKQPVVTLRAPDNRDRPFDIPDHVLTPTLADIYFQQGQYKLALQIFSRLIKTDPDNVKLLKRYNEIKVMVDHGDLPSNTLMATPKSTPDADIRLTPEKTVQKKSDPRKNIPKTLATDSRPLAGVRLKKRKKTVRKKIG